MSILTLQVGQCGNQVGHELFSNLAASAEAATATTTTSSSPFCTTTALEGQLARDMFFRAGNTAASASAAPVARAVMVDMEPKVVTRCISDAEKAGRFRYGTSVLTRQEGSANNWAFGYHVQGLCCVDAVMEEASRELREMDALKGIVLVHSAAGGTGSGVGSCLLERLRDEHPCTPITSVSVLPLHQGEIATQHYNTVLTLSHLQRHADASVIVDNSNLMARLAKEHSESLGGGAAARRAAGDASGGGASGQRAVDFERLNKRIAEDVAGGVLLPARFAEFDAESGALSAVPSRVDALHDFVQCVAPSRARKFVTLHSSRPSSREGDARWNVLLNDISRQRRGPAGAPGVPASSPSLLTVRGSVAVPEGGLSRIDFASPQGLFGPMACLAKGMPVAVAAKGRVGGGPQGCAVLASNDGVAVDSVMRRVGLRTKEMLSCGAYLHHFEKYGVEKDDCMSAVATVDQVVKDYYSQQRG